MSTLSVKVAARKSEAGEVFEGTVTIAGLKPTKLASKSDGSTQFPKKSALTASARNLAKSLGFSEVTFDEGKTEAKKAAKKSASKRTKATKAAASTSTETTAS